MAGILNATQDALQSSRSTDAASLAGATQDTATTYTPPEQELAAGRLTQMLTSGSPLLTAARTKAQQYAASRGLQRSSIAAQAGETAAIETATPIAQTDAGILSGARKDNAAAQNQFTSDANAFTRQSALNQSQGILSLTQSREGNALKQQELDQSQGQFEAQQSTAAAERRANLSAQIGEMRRQAQSLIPSIEDNANMDQQAKAQAISNLLAQTRADIAEMIRVSGIDLPDAWPDWLSNYSAGTAAASPAAAPYVEPSNPPG